MTRDLSELLDYLAQRAHAQHGMPHEQHMQRWHGALAAGLAAQAQQAQPLTD